MRDKVKGTTKYGWCLTGHHDKCPKQVFENKECTCECHGEHG